MRQWVLVTSSAPMTAWFYQDCYLRFCAEDYSLSDLTNVFSHLSNNCIARKSLHFESGVCPVCVSVHTGMQSSASTAESFSWCVPPSSVPSAAEVDSLSLQPVPMTHQTSQATVVEQTHSLARSNKLLCASGDPG